MRDHVVKALCSLEGMVHFPSLGRSVQGVSSRFGESWTPGSQVSPLAWLDFEGPWAACHPPRLKWRGCRAATWNLCLSRTLGISVSGQNPRVASYLEL